ncbi:MAG: DUF1858 domain-containing protein [Bacteroidota bacterium]
MSGNKTLIITPKTRVGELLDVYPQLEPVLMDLAPAFRKLKNPVLRKTVGKVATLQQAAALGNTPVTEIINTLRAEVGQELFNESNIQGEINFKEPDWLHKENVTVRFDATPLINAGENPMQEVFNHLEKTGEGEIFSLLTPFVPAPIIELIHEKGYAHYCHQDDPEECYTYFFLIQ